jgi:hypothetical protein
MAADPQAGSNPGPFLKAAEDVRRFRGKADCAFNKLLIEKGLIP